MPEQPILEVRGLTREFVRRGKPFPAVDDVNLTLDPGEFMAIVGRSGNGKSTLLNLVTGLLKPTSGSILLAGNEVTTLNDKQMSILRNRTIADPDTIAEPHRNRQCGPSRSAASQPVSV